MSDNTHNNIQLNAQTLRDALKSGINKVTEHREELNQINVFPVADGDTGTNLSLSLDDAIENSTISDPYHAGKFLLRFSEELLDSARGNSGTILAQFFQGITDSVMDKELLTKYDLAKATRLGSQYAYELIEKPLEGTILSVMRVFSKSINKNIQDKTLSLEIAFNKATKSANEELLASKRKLEVLAAANVVDAGAKGFVLLIEGINQYLSTGKITKSHKPKNRENNLIHKIEKEGKYRFCVECLITKKNINRKQVKSQLKKLGDSILIAGNSSKTKVHIHTNTPEMIFEICSNFGELSKTKADDMYAQNNLITQSDRKFAVITDSAADIREKDLEELNIDFVPCRIQFDSDSYLDKVSISSKEFFEKLKSNSYHPKTSQPSPGDFIRHFDHLANHFPDVISINLTNKHSGTYQTAKSMASKIKATGNIHVINSKNLSVGQGQLAIFAAKCSKAGFDINTTIDQLKIISGLTTTYALIPDTSFAVKGGRIPPLLGKFCKFLKVTPLLFINKDGKLSIKRIFLGKKKIIPQFSKYLSKKYNTSSNLNIAIGHAACKKDADKLKDLFLKELPSINNIYITSIGAALGVHCGPNSLAVSIQDNSKIKFLCPENNKN